MHTTKKYETGAKTNENENHSNPTQTRLELQLDLALCTVPRAAQRSKKFTSNFARDLAVKFAATKPTERIELSHGDRRC